MARIYKFAEEGKHLIVDTTAKGGLTFLETLDGKIREAQLRLAKLQAEISEAIEKNKNIKEFVATQARRDAERIIEDAKKAAEELIERAESEREKIMLDAYNEGFQKGMDEGLKKGIEEVEKLCTQLKSWMKDMQIQRHEFLKEAEEQIFNIALAIAEKIVKTQVDINKEIVLQNIRAALSQIEAEEEIIIKVHPDDIETLSLYKERLKEEAKGVGRLNIEPDPSVHKGGCRIYTKFGFLDADIPAQFQRIRESVRE